MTHIRVEATLPRVTDDGPPPLIAPFQRGAITYDEQAALGSRERDVHTPRVLEETDGLQIRPRTNTRQDDNILLLPLETVNRVESARQRLSLTLARSDPLDTLEDTRAVHVHKLALEFPQLFLVHRDDSDAHGEIDSLPKLIFEPLV